MLVKTFILVGLTLLCGSRVGGIHAASADDLETKMEFVLEALSYMERWSLKVEDVLQKLNESFPEWSNCSKECGGGYKTRPKLECPENDQENCTEIMYCNPQRCHADYQRERVATCKIETDPRYLASYKFSGEVILSQRKGQPLKVIAVINNESPKEANDKSIKHGFHVHTYGDIRHGCAVDDQDFNPDDVTHGYIDSQIRHVGDWGNIDLEQGNITTFTFTDNVATLFGDRSIIGRSLVIHEKEDDGGINADPESKRSGNTGVPVACCVIGLAFE
ncbi:unnamed protein product [Lymnaea stagnalis]|uniref:Superoxide dismutase copper/zinc binding domain-containing protein n=1 Tax=Lymnaea stagnalis TaxID=6523 RepID=A0AAV2HZX2_LYMST